MAELERVWRVYEDGRHNAFTDLARWHEQWWLTFRNGKAHSSSDGVILVLRSADLETWELTARVETEDDDRDPHFIITEERLWIYFGSRTTEGQDQPVIRSLCTYTSDGSGWSQPTPIYEPHFFLWHPFWMEGEGFFGAAYQKHRPNLPGRGPSHFLRSLDGISWSYVSELQSAEEEPSEAHFHRQADGTLVGIVRWGNEKVGSTLVSSQPPYTDWETKKLNILVHAPYLLPVGDRLLLAGRCLNEQMPAHLSPGSDKYATALWWFEEDGPEPILLLPSAADNAYPGMVLSDDGSVIVSYYSQHEYLDQPGFQPSGPPASIYLAKVRV